MAVRSRVGCALAALLLLTFLPHVVAAASDRGTPEIHCILGVGNCSSPQGPPSQSTTLAYSPSQDVLDEYAGLYGYNTGATVTLGGPGQINWFNLGDGHFSPNNKTATSVKPANKSGCKGYASDPVEIDDGAKLLTIPLFALPGEMGLKYTLYYHSVTSSSFWAYNPWASSISYALDLYCGYTNPNSPCSQVTLYRPDGSSISFSGNHASYGKFPEIGGGGLATLTHNSDGTWTAHDEDATVQTYDQYGYFQSIKDASGIGWTVTSSTTTTPGSPPVQPCDVPTGVHPLCVVDPPPPTYPKTTTTTVVKHTNGQSFTIVTVVTSLPAGLKGAVTVTDPAGNQYSYSLQYYQVPGSDGLMADDLASLTFPGSPATTMGFEYTGSNQLLSEVDYNGTAYWMTGYDSNNRVNSDGAADGTETTSILYAYPSGGMVATITNPLGHTTTNTYTADSQGFYLLTSLSNSAVIDCGSTLSSSLYDSNDNLKQTVDNNNVTHLYNYAANGQLQNETEGYNTATPRTTTYVWDSNQQLNRITSITVKGTTLNYNKTVYGYNAQNRLASVAVTNLTQNGTHNQTLTTSYTYTLYGNGMVQQMVVTAPSPSDTAKVTINYDTLGNVTSVTQVNGSTTIATNYSNYNGLGEPQKIVGPNGDETDYTYDARGRISTKTTHPYGVAATWTYTYDGYGLLKQVSAPDGEVTVWNRDAEMRVNTITHNDKDGTSTETLGYDDNNDVTTDTITRGTDTGYKATIVYDGLGRIYQVKGNHGQVLTYAYDGNGNVLSVTDALSHQTSYTYDVLNRVSTMTDAKSGFTQYAYDTGDHLTQVIDPRGLTTTYTWDGLGLLWKQVSPDTGTTSFNYDTYGRLATKTRADSLQTTYTYDSLNRLASRSSNGNTRTYTWDTCANGKGRLCRAINQGFNSVGYSYTPEGWIGGRSFVISGGPTYSLGYSYDNMGHLSVVNYPDGNQALYSYTDGVVSKVNLQVGSYLVTGVNGIVYRPMDLAMSNWTSYNGLTNTIGYDSDLRPTSISVPGIQSLGFTYDNADRINTITNGIDGTMSQTLGYDELDRLKTVTSTADNESYDYDADGNRTSGVVNGVATTYTVSPSSNRLNNVSGGMNASYGYDAQGNLTTLAGSTIYTYGPFGELASAGGMSYKHGADGQRLLKSGAPGTTYFAPDAGGALLAEEQGSTWYDYVWLNGRLVNVIANGGVFSLHDDQTGRPQVMTDPQNHNIDWAARNTAFDRTVTANAWGNFDIGFPGQYHDSESGLWQNGYRDYNPSLGRYVESDPIGLAGGVNTYAYVGNNPLEWVDPLGLFHVTLSFGGTLITPFSGVSANLNFDFNIDGWNSNAAIQDQFSAGPGAGFYLGYGPAISFSKAGDPLSTGFNSASYLEGDIGYDDLSFGANLTGKCKGADSSFATGIPEVKGGFGWGIGVFGGTTYTATAASPTLGSIFGH